MSETELTGLTPGFKLTLTGAKPKILAICAKNEVIYMTKIAQLIDVVPGPEE